jgi:HSP20 family protein
MRRISDWADEMSGEDFYSPDVDVIDRADELVVKIDLPGVKKEDINLNVTTDMVEVKSEKTEEDEESDDDFYLSERYFRGFYRKIALPKTIIPEEAKAKFRNGVLEIIAPKYEEESSAIEIED